MSAGESHLRAQPGEGPLSSSCILLFRGLQSWLTVGQKWLFLVMWAIHEAAHHMVSGFPQNQWNRERKNAQDLTAIFLLPNLRSNIPSSLLYSIYYKLITKSNGKGLHRAWLPGRRGHWWRAACHMCGEIWWTILLNKPMTTDANPQYNIGHNYNFASFI